jgi:hypothetical protein
MSFAKAVVLFAAVGGLGACVTSLTPAEADQAAKTCRAELGTSGSYGVRMTGRDAYVWPVVGAYGLKDGTQAEAEALTACIERKVAPSDVAGVPQSVSTVQTGTGRTDTFTYGTPPATTTPSSPRSSGNGRNAVCNPLSGGAGYGCIRP